MTDQPYYPDYFNDSDEIPTVHGPESGVYGTYAFPGGGGINIYHNPTEPSGLGFSLILAPGMEMPFIKETPVGCVYVSRLNQIPTTWVKQ